MRSSFSIPLLYHAYVYLESLILACTIYILAPSGIRGTFDCEKFWNNDESVFINIVGRGFSLIRDYQNITASDGMTFEVLRSLFLQAYFYIRRSFPRLDSSNVHLLIVLNTQFHFIIAHDLTKLRNIKWSKSDSTANQNRLCRFASNKMSIVF